MKLLFILIAAFLVVGTSAQSDPGTELQQIINAIQQRTDAAVTNFANNLNALASSAVDLAQASWNALKNLSFFSISYTNNVVNIIVENVLNITRESIRNDANLRTAAQNYFANARQLWNQTLADYLGLRNVTSGIYQCWETAEPQIDQVLTKFVNNTIVQSKTPISDYNTIVIAEHAKLAGNITLYQLGVSACLIRIFSFRSCVDSYWQNNRAGLQAAFDNFRYSTLTARNDTYLKLETIVNNNAQIARNELIPIDNAFDLCVNNTLTTTTTLAP